MSDFSLHIAEHYRRRLGAPMAREFYGNSDFLNVGYWYDGTKNARDACENMMKELLSLIPEKKGNILDVACGKGASTRYLLKYFSPNDVVGINISKEHLDVCRSNVPECEFLEMDATELSFPDNAFDNMICVEAAFHFDTREKFLQEAYRVLKPGGFLILADILAPARNRNQPKENWLEDIKGYKAILDRASFADVTVMDTTERCYHGYVDNLCRFLRDRVAAGEIKPWFFKLGLRMAEKAKMEHTYLFARCRKHQR